MIMSVAKRDAPGVIFAFDRSDSSTNTSTHQSNVELLEALIEFRDCNEVSIVRVERSTLNVIITDSELESELTDMT